MVKKDPQSSWAILRNFFEQFEKLSDEEFEQWKAFCELRSFNKKTILVRPGEVEAYINIVAEGLVRKYIKAKKGEVTLQISPEKQIIHAERSFHSQEPSNVFIETIERTTLVSISYNNLQLLYEKYPKAERLARKFVTEMFIVKDRRNFDLIRKSTRESFMDYMNSHPQMLQRVPQKYIASYLNIKPETFSRLKHLLRKKV